jgi:hypothetical protein
VRKGSRMQAPGTLLTHQAFHALELQCELLIRQHLGEQTESVTSAFFLLYTQITSSKTFKTEVK